MDAAPFFIPFRAYPKIDFSFEDVSSFRVNSKKSNNAFLARLFFVFISLLD